MEFDEILKKRRSVRKFQPKEISTEVLVNLIQESTLAPSAGNEQPWRFIIIKNSNMIKRVSDECKKNFIERISNNPGDYAEKYEKMLRNKTFNIFYNAPAVVLILGDSDVKNLYVDCALAACYFMMAATHRGLGSCWINFGTEIHDPQITKELGIPKNHTIVAPIAIGYPDNIPDIPKRKDMHILKVIEQEY